VSSLRILFYMFKADASGQQVRDALLAAPARGVEVSGVIDGCRSDGVPDSFFKPLLEEGCHFSRFEPRWGRRYLLRNHQKFALADDDRVITGGVPLAPHSFRAIQDECG